MYQIFTLYKDNTTDLNILNLVNKLIYSKELRQKLEGFWIGRFYHIYKFDYYNIDAQLNQISSEDEYLHLSKISYLCSS
jgi:hypothetical protein